MVRAGTRNGHSTGRSYFEPGLLALRAGHGTRTTARSEEPQSAKQAMFRATSGTPLRIEERFRLELRPAQRPCSDARHRDGSTLEAMRILHWQTQAQRTPRASTAISSWQSACACKGSHKEHTTKTKRACTLIPRGLRAPTLLASKSSE